MSEIKSNGGTNQEILSLNYTMKVFLQVDFHLNIQTRFD